MTYEADIHGPLSPNPQAPFPDHPFTDHLFKDRQYTDAQYKDRQYTDSQYKDRQYTDQQYTDQENHFPSGSPYAHKKTAIAFVDYEHWFYSMHNHYNTIPDVQSWYQELVQKYDLKDVYIYADFSHEGIAGQMNNLRLITNNIISTQNSDRSRKDMSDIIILDSMYQSVIERPNIETWILFTGDGHFQSVVKFLRQKCHKEVIVYGVKNCFSKWLMEAASSYVVVPSESADVDPVQSCMLDIIENFIYLHNSTNNQPVVLTFHSVSTYIATKSKLGLDFVQQVLNQMLDLGLVETHTSNVRGKRTQTLEANWSKLQAAGLVDVDY